MPTFIMSKPASKLDPAIKKKAYAFLEKLTEDDTAPGLHIEPIRNSADPRVRTGRVDQGYRAVLFKVVTGTAVTYVFHGIWPHDEAIRIAQTTTLKVNPVNGIAEIITVPLAETREAGQAAGGGRSTTEQSGSRSQLRQPVAQPVPLLSVLGVTEEDLVGKLGIDQRAAKDAMTAIDDDELLEIVAELVEWQALALLDLASGHTVSEVKEAFSLKLYSAASAPSTDEELLLQGLRHPAAQLTFAWIEDNDELRRVVEGGDFGVWRVFLHPEQRKYAERSYNGPFRLSGGAGTGKTVVLLHRARMLARANPQARVLVTTFTTNLADQMRADLNRLDPGLQRAGELGGPGVHVIGIDALANQILKRAGQEIARGAERVVGVPTDLVQGRTGSSAWQTAIDVAGDSLPEVLRTDAFFVAEYAAIVLPNLVTSREQYYRVRRPGRGVALSRARRAAVWSVIEAYRAKARVDGTVDFAEAATLAATHARHVGYDAHLADHILVDEGQDLSPAHWQLLRALVGEHADDLFIAEDSHQRIYGQRVVLGAYGIRIVGRSQRLTLNYRTTAQNLAYAIRVLEGGEYVDLEEGAEKSSDYRSARSGPRPSLYPCETLSVELDNAAQVLKRWLADGSTPAETIAILVRFATQRDRVVNGLVERGVSVRAVDRAVSKPGLPVVMTMHRAKGTEFARVLLFGIGASAIPGRLKGEKYSEEAAADALLRERSLLYVAATRARDELAISWSGDASEFVRPLE